MMKESFELVVPRELKAKYLKRKSEDIERLRILSNDKVFQEAIKLGHQVKGNAVSFEFPILADIGREIEKAGLEGDSERLELLLNRLESLIKDSEKNLI